MAKTVEQLRAENLPHATVESVGIRITPKDESPEAAEELRMCLAALAEYFHGFADADGKCPDCGRNLGGMFGSFSWGMANGEGHCGCGYPCRVYHRDIDIIGFFQCILPYHPDSLMTKTERQKRDELVGA